ncbi:MAG TPA: lanthionine synthetase C family protein [Pseudonocardiaceae bacterium]
MNVDSVVLTDDDAIRQSLAKGAAGTALLYIERAWAGTGSWQTAHAHIRNLMSGPIDGAQYASLYYGAPAIAFVLHAAADRHPRYRAAAVTLDEHTRRLARTRLAIATARRDQGEPVSFGDVDIFSGLTGIGALLLAYDPRSDALTDVLRYIISLTRPRRDDDGELPGWWTGHDPDRNVPTPGGHANFGMAHGAAGLLAFLALATRHGHEVDGQRQAIAALTGWFDQWRQNSDGIPWWPHWITRSELRMGRTDQLGPGRPSWCYGTPGVARALQLAAIATADPVRQEDAENALAACLAGDQLRRAAEPGICHGMAGLYQTIYRAALDSPHDTISWHLPALASRLSRRGESVTGDGFLIGRAGFDLVLETTRSTTPPRSGWDKCLLIT